MEEGVAIMLSYSISFSSAAN